MKRIIFPLLFLVVLAFSCWNRQDHEVTKPLIPNYIFTGTAIDMDTAEPLPGTQIRLEEVNMLYEVEFGTQIINADSTGYFEFDSVYPGDYYLSYERNGYFIGSTRFSMEHKDTTAVIQVPQLFFGSHFEHAYSKSPAMACSGNNAWVNIYWWGSKPTNNTPPFIDTDMFMFYVNKSNNWINESKMASILNPRLISGMTFVSNGLMLCTNTDTIFQINRYDGALGARYNIDHTARGIALQISKKCIYTCSGTQLYRHNVDNPSLTDAVIATDAQNLAALAYYRDLYAFDNGTSLLLQFDQDDQIVTHYALLTGSGNQVVNVHDMSFDGYHNLWFTQ